ncbi:glycoside hydrolase family 13 protein [Agilicoccus flavus]|uniref:glycoside hydrolase family 13 protein n=1 Tax=Agilicoccus flavus TaxID=2775968 RepID=UPI001CF696AE|nr:alpha-glucosidase [Agilicoccus flavus]
MSEQKWWSNAVVYQIYPRSFADGNGDGVGDLPGILAHLDHVASLGVDVVWLSPVYRSPMDDNGYDISDYEHVDPLFGTDADLDAVIARCHELGLKLVMDLVVNHTSDEHEWFEQSRRGVDDPKRDWYWWAPPRAGHVGGQPGAEPTNWTSFFSGSTWEWDEASGEYYLHLFSRRQPDLNWENPQVRDAVYAMMNRWLDRGVDGFRMDVVNLISKAVRPDGTLPDGDAAPGEFLGDGMPFTMNGPRIHEFLHEMHERVFAGHPGRELITVGEMPGVTIDEARKFTDPARAEVDMVFQFEHVGLGRGPNGKFDTVDVDPLELKDSLFRWQEGLADVGWNSLYWCNHDQPRPVSRFGDDSDEHRVASATALATILHLQRGTPYVYQGEEIGMRNVPFATIDDAQDIESRNAYADALANGGDPGAVLEGIRAVGRDNARTPMQWTSGAHAGFTTGTPWLPAGPDHDRVNVAAQDDDPDSVLAHYRRLIALRHEDDTVALGDFTALAPRDPRVWAFTRRRGDDELLVLANCSGDDVEVEGLPEEVVAAYADARLVLGNRTRGGRPEPTAAPRRLRPWEAVVLRA